MKKIYSLFLTLFISASAFAAGHVVTATQTNVTCFGNCDGTATASISGGVGPFTYDWTPGVPVGDGTNAITNLCPGTYIITVTDNSDMSTANTSVTITEPPLLTVGLGGATICSGSCTTLSPLASGGTPPYTYSWTGGLFGPSPSACPLTTTTYTVTISDANGCIATGSSMVTVNPMPVVTVNSPTICAGATATLTGGGASTYVWNPGGATTVSISVSPATTTSYTVTGAASGGCTATAVSTVTVNPLPVVTANSPTICAGDTAILIVTGASTYIWSAGATPGGPSSATATPLTTTSYTVTGSTSGCTSSAIHTVTVIATPTATVPASATYCDGATVSPGIFSCPTCIPGPGSFTWTNSNTSIGLAASGTGSTPSFMAMNTGSTPITSTITVTPTYSGCVGTPSTYTITVDGQITSGITSTNATVCGICDGTVTLSPSGGTPPYTPSWGTTITGICPGTYVGTITDANGCTVTDSTNIYVSNDLIANFTMVPDSTDPYNFFGFNTSTGAGNSYAWDFGDGAVSTMASPTHTFALAGPYNVCLTASNFLCGADTLCQTINVTGVLDPCNALFNIADDTINPDPNAHYVYNLSYGATLIYLWDFGDVTTSTSATPSHVYSGTGPYLLCLSIDNGAGCTDMFCDSLISADSINRSSGIMQLTVYDVPTFYSVATGIANVTEAENVTVAPNPFNESTIFTVNSKELYSFELTDVLGKKVKSKNGISEKQFEISRDGLENGIYFYKIYTSESVIGIGKVVVK